MLAHMDKTGQAGLQGLRYRFCVGPWKPAFRYLSAPPPPPDSHDCFTSVACWLLVAAGLKRARVVWQVAKHRAKHAAVLLFGDFPGVLWPP